MLEESIIINTITSLNKKLIIAGFLIAAFAIGIYAYKEYNRKPANLQKVKTEISVKATDLIAAFIKQEDTANALYLGKIISVIGNVVEVQNEKDTSLTLFLGDTLQISKVSCLIDKMHIANAKKIALGDNVSIKGVCTGFLMDVELNRCVVEN